MMGANIRHDLGTGVDFGVEFQFNLVKRLKVVQGQWRLRIGYIRNNSRLHRSSSP
jgi:hypothetical protein